MTNHFHLIVDPGKNSDALALLMKRVAGRQTRYVNKLENRSSSLWEGRYKSSVISSREYLPACCRYIELNPLRAGMVTDPALYQWSSYGARVSGKSDLVVDTPPFYLSLGDTAQERRKAYEEYVLATHPDYELKLIREVLQRGHLAGGDHFRKEVEKKLGIRISNKKQGRPRKKK